LEFIDKQMPISLLVFLSDGLIFIQQPICQNQCIFRLIPATDSGAIRPPIPIHSGH
jgi:hypothetical protein